MLMKRKIPLIFFVVFLSTSSFAQISLQQFLNTPALKHATVGVCVKDLETNKTLVAHNADKSLTPASTLKLITTATALELLGPDYRYVTTLALDADNPSRILVLGSGDPTLGSDAFDEDPYAFLSQWADALKSSLPQKEAWELYIVDDLFGYEGVSPQWTWEDLGNYYAAGAYGISVFDNTYRIYFDTTDRNSCPKILRTDPIIKGLSFTNYLTLNTSGKDNGYIFGAPFSYERAIRGNIPAGRVSFCIKGDIPDPALLLGEKLGEYLQKSGINVSIVKTARTDYMLHVCNKTPPSYRVGEVLYVHRSRPLSDIVREINVESNNHFTEHVFRTIGRTRNADIYSDPLKEGIDFVNTFWESKGISTSSLFMYDGCGLAPQDAVSPVFLCNLLSYMHKKSLYSTVFFNSLPKAGEEGTLHYFMNKTKYAGKIRAKSGSISGVQCYAGYLMDGNKKYAFAVMVNKFTDTNAQIRTAIEKFLLSL
ncbi:MAG TPA: D-alanyl-D-alanine carboxypeptidase/D-alanyl-D-alanine-endopeptidase [Dysgonamonadaceae bacterium]|nr:D-alanyl-D-alanine carboxypeptidase/D-alanyl-D-alanine-endopeptidase [Dysgonamonadaceae bacterium]